MKTKLTYCLTGLILLACLPVNVLAQDVSGGLSAVSTSQEESHPLTPTANALQDSVKVDNTAEYKSTVQASDIEHPQPLPVCYENRGLANVKNQFIPKRNFLFGTTATWTTHTHDNYSFLLVENIYSEGYTFKFRPYVGYAVTNNLVLGLRFGYSRTNLSVDNLSVSIGDEKSGTHIEITDYLLLRHTYAGELFGRYYIPLGQSKRIAILIEGELGIAGSQAKYANGQPVKGTYETGMNYYLGVNPGLTVFLTNKFAIEATVGLVRFNYSVVNQIHNQVEEGSASTAGAKMKISLLDISLGLSFYL